MKPIAAIFALLFMLSAGYAGESTPVAWVRILSPHSEYLPNWNATQDFVPQRGWGYRDYHNDQDCHELTKQMARSGIKTILIDQTSFDSRFYERYRSDPDGAMSGNILAGKKTQDAAYRNGMTSAIAMRFDYELKFADSQWAEANETAGVFWKENVSRPGYEYAPDGKPLMVIFMRDPKAQTWAASYAKLAPQFRTWLDRYHIEIAGHRIYDGFPMFGWRPTDTPNVTWGDGRCRAITAIQDFAGTACSPAEWARRVDVALQATDYSTFCSYSDAESGSWGIMNLLSPGYSGEFLMPGNDPMAFYRILSKKLGGVASSFNEAVYDYGALGIFDTNADIGSPSGLGTATHRNCVYQLAGVGSDLVGISDQCRYLSKPWTGNGMIVTRIDSIQGAHAQSRAGLMARMGTNGGAACVFIGAKPDNVLSCIVRKTDGAASQEKLVSGIKLPCWVRITRASDELTAEYSNNGFDWTLAGKQSMPSANGLLAGLAVSSGLKTSTCSSRFSNVSESFTAPASMTFNRSSNPVLFTQMFDGKKNKLTPGSQYSTAAFDLDRTVNSELVTAVGGTFANKSIGKVSAAVVAAGNAGISPGMPNGFEDKISFAPRIGPGFTIGKAARGKAFRLTYAELVIADVFKNGFQASVAYERRDGSTRFLHFNNGRPLTTGTFGVDLRTDNLIWTDTATPLADENGFKLVLINSPKKENTVADGILVSLKIYAETGPFAAAPTGLTAVPGNGSVQLRWVGRESVTYCVYRRMPGASDFMLLAKTTSNSYPDETACNGIPYSYAIRAIDAAGKESDNSNLVTATPVDAIPPAAPKALVTLAGPGPIRLDWADNAEENLGGYHVYRLTAGTYVRIASCVSCSIYLDQSANPNMANSYRISAINRSGVESPFTELRVKERGGPGTTPTRP